MTEAVILFDGYCRFCSATMRFVNAHGPPGRWRMVPLQGREGRALAQWIGIDPDDPASVAVIKGAEVLTDSAAVMAIAESLNGRWRLLSLLRILPKTILDPVYRWFAHNRYRIAGRRSCQLPDDMDPREIVSGHSFTAGVRERP